MKKFMSLVIAVLFALGMTTVAFAADTTATNAPAAPAAEKKAPAKKKAKKVKKAKKAAPKTDENATTPAPAPAK